MASPIGRGRGIVELPDTDQRWSAMTRGLWETPTLRPRLSAAGGRAPEDGGEGDRSAQLELTEAVARAPIMSAPPPSDLKITFSGELEELPGFLAQITSYLKCYGPLYASEAHRVQYILGKLRGEAQEWLLELQRSDAEELRSVEALAEGLWRRFGDPYWRVTAGKRLRSISQNGRSVFRYASEFRKYASRVPDWPLDMLLQCFREGLDRNIVEAALAVPEPKTLEEWIVLARSIEERRDDMMTAEEQRRRQRPPHAVQQSGRQDSARRQPRCFGCGSWNHFLAACPDRPRPVASTSRWSAPRGGVPGASTERVRPVPAPRVLSTPIPAPRGRTNPVVGAAWEEEPTEGSSLAGNEEARF